MQCDQVQLELEAYLFGSLEADVQSAIKEHLSCCQACSEEADAMNKLGEKLSGGLHDWVNEGVCPPEVLARLQSGVAGAKGKAWWQGRFVVPAVAAVAVVLLALMWQQGDLSQVPLVQQLAADLFHTAAPSSDTPVRAKNILASSRANGTTLTVYQLEVVDGTLRLHFSLRGGNFDTQADPNQFDLQLKGDAGPITLRHITATNQTGELAFTADFDLTPTGQPLTLEITQLPADRTKTAGQAFIQGPWRVSFQS